ncbi:hypothetical protein H1C71_018759, partial [Ictidomys tridecemlineatus]
SAARLQLHLRSLSPHGPSGSGASQLVVGHPWRVRFCIWYDFTCAHHAGLPASEISPFLDSGKKSYLTCISSNKKDMKPRKLSATAHHSDTEKKSARDPPTLHLCSPPAGPLRTRTLQCTWTSVPSACSALRSPEETQLDEPDHSPPRPDGLPLESLTHTQKEHFTLLSSLQEGMSPRYQITSQIPLVKPPRGNQNTHHQTAGSSHPSPAFHFLSRK